MRVGIIGFGGIGQTVVETIARLPEAKSIDMVGVLDLPEAIAAVRADHSSPPRFVDNLHDLIAAGPEIVAECAGHGAVIQHAQTILQSGIDLALLSTGALGDEALFDELKQAAAASGAKIFIPAGAVAGVDGLRAALCSGVSAVRYTGRKPPLAWVGTPAEQHLSLAELKEPATFYEGSAREAALEYPKNSNVAAIVALAGLGFESTQVRLIADPTIRQNQHEIDVEANTGRFSVQLAGETLAINPKTSALAAFSMVRCLIDRQADLVF